MKRFAAASAAALLTAVLTHPATATAASDSDTTSIPVDPANQIRNAGQCRLRGRAEPVLLQHRRQPADARRTDRVPRRRVGAADHHAAQFGPLAWEEASYSAPSGMPREIKGANHDNVLSKLFKSTTNVEISVTYFGGGPIERFRIDGDSAPIDWGTGQPRTQADFIACSQIQVVYGGVNLTTPTACAQTTFS